ncbi:MAG: hypothetical protein OEZ34_13050 [Spirochaetia bacterium]|nr:hypothetical protein [Spirochaetia bacterium]
MKLQKLFFFNLFLVLSACGSQFDENVSGNWNLIVARNLDQAGDFFHASEYLMKAMKENDAKESAESYLENINKRKEKASDCVKDARFNLDTSFLTRYHFRDYFQMGYCYELLGDERNALESYNHSIQLNQKHAMTYTYRGLLHEKSGRIQEAEKDLRLAVQKEGGHLSPRFHLGMFFIRNRKIEFVEEQAAALEESRPIYTKILREEMLRKNENR